MGGNFSTSGDFGADNNVWGTATTQDIIASSGYAPNWVLSGDFPINSVDELFSASDGTLYAGLASADNIARVYKSTDYGRNWTLTGGLGGARHVDGLAESEGVIYAGTKENSNDNYNVFKYDPDTNTWASTAPLLPTLSGGEGARYVTSLIAGSDGSIYAGTGSWDNDGTVYRSDDAGASWVETADLPGATQVYALLQASDGAIYAGTYSTFNGDIFKTTDKGLNWTLTTDIPNVIKVSSLIQADDGTIYAATYGDIPAEVIVYKTLNGGGTWVATGTQVPAGYNVNALLQATDGAIYAASGDVYKTTNGGDTWVATGGGQVWIDAYSLVQADEGTIFAGTTAQGDIYMLQLAGLAAGDYSCPAGHFMKNIYKNNAGQVYRLECRGL